MPTLPDPRCFAAAESEPLLRLATECADVTDATQRTPLAERLRRELRNQLVSGRERSLRERIDHVPSPAAGRCLWEAIDQVLSTPEAHAPLAAAVFAIPVVFVAGGSPGTEVSGVIPEPSRLARVLEAAGALGRGCNFGLNGALCTRQSLLGSSFADLFARLRAVETGAPARSWELPPAPITLDDSEEHVELRFLTGIAVSGAQAPSLVSTAADIARWGMPLARELIAQLGQSGLSLLPIPRPPQGWLGAHHAGSRAREELALQAFVSRAVRAFRSTEADPRVRLTALQPSAIGVRLESQLNIVHAVSHLVLLHPLDDLPQVLASMLELFRDCRLDSVELVRSLGSEADFRRGQIPSRPQ